MRRMRRSTARRAAATYHEFVLDVDEEHLASRLRARALSPSRPEHAVNALLVGPDDAAELIRSLSALLASRPGAIVVDANGALQDTVASIAAALR